MADSVGLFSAEEPAPPSVLRRLLGAVPRVLVGVAFLFIGYTKFDSDPRGGWVQIFEEIGLGQWFRIFTGVMQVGGGLLMFARRTMTIGAAALLCTMLGAAFVDLVVLGQPFFILPLLLGIVIATVWVMSR
jgi:putative oxidoreductase